MKRSHLGAQQFNLHRCSRQGKLAPRPDCRLARSAPSQALDEEQAEKQRKQQLAAMEEGEVATSPPGGGATGSGHPGGAAAPAGSAGGGVRSPSFAQPYHSGGPGAPHGFGPLGPLGPKVPGDPAAGYGGGAAYGGGSGGGAGFYGGRGGPAAGPAGGGGGELWDDNRTRDAWGAAAPGPGPGPGSTTSTPRGPRDMLGPALGFGSAGGGTPLAGDRERERAGGEFGWRSAGDYRGGPPGGSGGGRDRGGWRGSFDERRWVAGRAAQLPRDCTGHDVCSSLPGVIMLLPPSCLDARQMQSSCIKCKLLGRTAQGRQPDQPAIWCAAPA